MPRSWNILVQMAGGKGCWLLEGSTTTVTKKVIVQLIKPIYANLGSRSLLEKCTGGYTQNDNESLYSLVWKFCPKELFQGRVGVEVARALAMYWLWISSLASRLQLHPTPFCTNFLRQKDKKRVKSSVYRDLMTVTERCNVLCCLCWWSNQEE